jgi:putative glutamine amidotransferase
VATLSGLSGLSDVSGVGGVSGTVLVSATSAERAVPYVEALKAGGVAAEAIRVVTAQAMGAGGTAAAAGFSASQPAGRAAVREWIGGAGGLLLCGGADIEPWRYGEEPVAAAGLELLPGRDALEWELLAAARDRRLPVWGVCRGFQMLNVFLGGSLWQDLPMQRPGTVPHDLGSPPDLLSHEVCVLAPRAPLGERLAAAGSRPLVNSRHHQGIRRLAPGLLAVAAAPDGLIEAAVLTDDGFWWLRGVEWHPENLLELGEQLALWRDFAAAVAGFASQGAGRGLAAAAAPG